jgi:hypothetical protein
MRKESDRVRGRKRERKEREKEREREKDQGLNTPLPSSKRCLSSNI